MERPASFDGSLGETFISYQAWKVVPDWRDRDTLLNRHMTGEWDVDVQVLVDANLLDDIASAKGGMRVSAHDCNGSEVFVVTHLGPPRRTTITVPNNWGE